MRPARPERSYTSSPELAWTLRLASNAEASPMILWVTAGSRWRRRFHFDLHLPVTDCKSKRIAQPACDSAAILLGERIVKPVATVLLYIPLTCTTESRGLRRVTKRPM